MTHTPPLGAYVQKSLGLGRRRQYSSLPPSAVLACFSSWGFCFLLFHLFCLLLSGLGAAAVCPVFFETEHKASMFTWFSSVSQLGCVYYINTDGQTDPNSAVPTFKMCILGWGGQELVLANSFDKGDKKVFSFLHGIGITLVNQKWGGKSRCFPHSF